MGEYKEGGLEVRPGRVEDRREVTSRKIEVEEGKVRVEREEDRRAEECKVVGPELEPEKEEDRNVGDDPGEAGMFVENEAEEEGEGEVDD